jgi:hypothetical protein
MMTAFSHAYQSTRRWANSTRVSIGQLREMYRAAPTRRDEDLVRGILNAEETRWAGEQAARVDGARAVLAERTSELSAAANLLRTRLADLSSDLQDGRITAREARGLLRDHVNSVQLMRAELAIFPDENARIQRVAERDVGDWQADLLRTTPTLIDNLASWPPE